MSGWTYKTLKHYLDARIKAAEKSFAALMHEREVRNNQRFDAQEKAVKAALDAAKEATGKAETAADKRFNGLNELRDMVGDWRTEFARQETVAEQMKGLAEKIEGQGRQIAALDKGSGEATGWGLGLNQALAYVIALAAIGVAFFK